MATILKGIHAPARRGENKPKTRAPIAKAPEIESPHAKFNLPHNTVFFISTICTHQMFPKNRRGTLYLFDSHIVFESQVSLDADLNSHDSSHSVQMKSYKNLYLNSVRCHTKRIF